MSDESGEGPRASARRVRVAVASILLALLLVELDVARKLSLTCDEVCDMAAGVADLEHGRPELFPERPPLPRRLGGGVLHALGLREGPQAASVYPAALARYNTHYVYAERLVYDDGARFGFAGARPGPASEVLAARLPFLVFPLLLGLVTFAWASARFGPAGGLLALLLVATYPDVLGHGPLAVEDGALAALGLFAAFAADRFRVERSWRWILALGVGTGLALGTKLTAPALLGGVAIALLSARVLDRRLAVSFVVALATLSVLYRGAEPVTAYLHTFRSLPYLEGAAARATGSGAGEYGRAYFLVCTLLKAPLGTLALLGLAAWAARTERGSRAEELGLHLPGALLFLALSLVGKPHGARYVLPAIPFLLVSCGRLAPWAGRSRARWAAIALALAANVGGAALDHPFHASAVNRLAGPPERAYRWLNDSNQDWGGGYLALAAWQRAHGNPPITVVPFGSNYELRARPGAGYELRFDDVPWLARLEPWGVRGQAAQLDALFAPERGRVYAVSAMAAHRALELERETAFLGPDGGARRLVLGGIVRPTEVVGGGLLVFDLREPR